MTTWLILGTLVLVLALFVIPFGIPGTWIQVALLAVAAYFDRFSLVLLVIAVLLALVGEVAEYALVRRLTARYGGSRHAFWGALGGGLVGVLIGVPIPIVGSVVAGIVGSFAGAGLVAYLETRDLPAAGRVGWGVVLARVLAAGVKLAVGITIVVVGFFGLLQH